MFTPGVMRILADEHYSLLSLFRRYCDENPILSPDQTYAQHGHDAVDHTQQQFLEMSPASFVLMATDFHLQKQHPEPSTNHNHHHLNPNHHHHHPLNPNPDTRSNPNTNKSRMAAQIVSDVLLLDPKAHTNTNINNTLHFNSFLECILVAAWRSQPPRSSHRAPV